MELRKFTAAALPVIVGVAVGAGTAHANPAAPEVRYETALVGNTVRTTLQGGFFEVSADERTVDVKSAVGDTLVTLPLSVRQDGLEYPLPHRVGDAGQVLELTAVKDVAAARPAPVTPVASPAENQWAMEAFGSQFGIATAIGGFIGTAIGAAIGLVVGLASPIFEPATIITGAAIGGIIGTLVAGGPALVIAGIDLMNTLSAPPGTTKWMDTTGRR
ncbi:ammonium transporter [Nocardia blacklockiae]|uniref:ammonium transporter n=1 Tax=Nocardia blacklockiae TaxID=480036 RepID=UPI001895454A|nr:ammonium transporter [Nocardia blacklockiae]MBF6171610.1 ammonium transporter [Nocardia blacklockiae]